MIDWLLTFKNLGKFRKILVILNSVFLLIMFNSPTTEAPLDPKSRAYSLPKPIKKNGIKILKARKLTDFIQLRKFKVKHGSSRPGHSNQI